MKRRQLFSRFLIWMAVSLLDINKTADMCGRIFISVLCCLFIIFAHLGKFRKGYSAWLFYANIGYSFTIHGWGFHGQDIFSLLF